MKRLAALLIAAGCASQRGGPGSGSSGAVNPTAAATTATPAPPPPEAVPPALRLSETIRPVRYRPTLTVVPGEDSFSGTIEIDLDILTPTSVIWLNAQDLTIQLAEVRAHGTSFPARALAQPKDYVGIALSSPLPPGDATLRMSYVGRISRRDNAGVFQTQEGGTWYVTTHFEPIDARRAYPCFDEPSFKVPWQLSLRIKPGQQAFSNTPLEQWHDEGDGFTTVTFAQTRPLPSYLTAFAIGQWERLDAGRTGRGGTPVGVIVPQGLASQAAFATRTTPQALSHLEDWFGIAYPFEKLDIIAVPLGRGAMENVGLVTYGSTLLLVPKDLETPGFRRGQASVSTHELAHMWFGDLVTNAWWDDIWLNEAFATWMTFKTLESWHPEWGVGLDRLAARGRAMAADSLLSARRIRQSIESDDDTLNAFDAITYQKGASVIHMFEQFVGPEKFQRGVQHYLRAHAYSIATARDFLADVSSQAGLDIQSAFSTFLDQAGLPLVTAQVRCERGRKPVLEMTQERYFPLGTQAAQRERDQIWQIPVCARWSGGRTCALLGGKSGALELPSRGCPSDLIANAGGAGYYHLAAEEERLLADGGRRLQVAERLAVLQDLRALANAGRLDYGVLLRAAARLAPDADRHVVEASIAVAMAVRDARLVREPELPQYRRWIRDVYSPRAQKVGWTARRGETDEVKLLRSALFKVLGDSGDDPDVVSSARQMTQAWLANRAAVDPALAPAALVVAAQHGDRALFDALHSAARNERERYSRQLLLEAMGSFRDPAIAREAMQVALSDEFPAREAIALVYGATHSESTRGPLYDFVREHFGELIAKLPALEGAGLVAAGSALCDETRRVDVESFFEKRISELPGGRRRYAQAMEQLRTCASVRAAQGPAVARFFAAAHASR